MTYGETTVSQAIGRLLSEYPDLDPSAARGTKWLLTILQCAKFKRVCADIILLCDCTGPRKPVPP